MTDRRAIRESRVRAQDGENRTVACRLCHAKVGDPCTDESGVALHKVHTVRLYDFDGTSKMADVFLAKAGGPRKVQP